MPTAWRPPSRARASSSFPTPGTRRSLRTPRPGGRHSRRSWRGWRMAETAGGTIEGSGGVLAVAALRADDVQGLFTLSGGDIFPIYDRAGKADPPVPIVDPPPQQTAP